MRSTSSINGGKHPAIPLSADKSIYLGVVLSRKDGSMKRKYALIEVPSKVLGRLLNCHLQMPTSIISFCLKISYATTCAAFSHILDMTDMNHGFLK